MSVRMSRDEAWAVLAAAHTGIFTTLRRDGVPITLPVWFVVDDRRIYLFAPAPTKKIARVRHDPRCSFLVESGERWVELQAVHVTGRARIVDDDPELATRIQGMIDAKYAAYRSDHSKMPDETREVYEPTMALIEIIPDDRVLNWDNSRLGMA